MRVRHAEAMAEFVQQGREVEAARLQPGFGPADVACVELGLPFVLLVGRAHPAKERRARARRSEIGDDLEVGLGAIVHFNEDKVGNILIDTQGGEEGILFPLFETLGDHILGGARIGRILTDEDVAGLGEIEADDVLALDPVRVGAHPGKGVAGDARPFFAVGIA